MATIESPETLGLRPIHEFQEAQETWPRGDRPAAIREAAETFRGRFKEQGQIRAIRTVDLVAAAYPTRSEEHTSELQSRSDLVCRLLLEKKKKKKQRHTGNEVIHV